MTWPTKKLGEIASVDWGNTSITKASYKPSGYLAVSATGPDGFMDSFEHNRSAIILSAIGAKCGKTFWVEGKWTAIKNTITIFSDDENICLTGYLYYFLTPNKWKIVGGGQPFITKGAAESVKIPLPPLAIQRQIVKRLDKIAEAQKLNDGLIQKTDELFQSLLHKELNQTGKNWEVKKMEELVENVKIGPFGSALKIAELSDNGPVRVLFIENVVNNKFELAKEKYISEKKYKELEVYTVEPDDILITMMGTIGRTCITPKNLGRAIISSHLIKITPNKKIAIPEYLNFSLHSPYVTDQIRRKAKGAIMKGLNSKILRNLDTPLPPLETQKQIVAKLSAVQDYKKQLLEQKSKLKELFDSSLAKSMKN